MKKYIFSKIVIILILLLLVGCTDKNNYLYNPIRFPNTVWKSDDVDIYFHVQEGSDSNYSNVGKLKVEGKDINISLVFDHGTTVYIIDTELKEKAEFFDDAVILEGECKFYSDKLVVRLKKNDLLDPNINTITFIKYDEDYFCENTEDKKSE